MFRGGTGRPKGVQYENKPSSHSLDYSHVAGSKHTCGFDAGAECAHPDRGLDSAIRTTLAKPTGPLTVQDLLSVTNLNASQRSISNLAGLEFATNLLSLNLQANLLSNPSAWFFWTSASIYSPARWADESDLVLFRR
jgi:hypothetical protein